MKKIKYNELLELGSTRRSTKQYDKELRIPREDIDKIYAFVRTAPHSIGMELTRFININPDSELKQGIAEHLKGANTERAMDASDLVIVVTKTEEFFDKKNSEFKDRMKEITKYHLSQNKKPYVIGMEKIFIKQFLNGAQCNQKDKNEEWSSRQSYIQLAYLLLGAASLNINTTPLEGFEPSITDYLREIGLISNTEKVTLCALMGYISENTPKPYIGNEQFRKSIENIVTKY